MYERIVKFIARMCGITLLFCLIAMILYSSSNITRLIESSNYLMLTILGGIWVYVFGCFCFLEITRFRQRAKSWGDVKFKASNNQHPKS